jgi:hypothetical protein
MGGLMGAAALQQQMLAGSVNATAPPKDTPRK